jgi:predicted metal-dependent hydrolase
MNWLQKLLDWLKPAAAQSQTQPTIGDRLVQIAADYLRQKKAEAQAKANAANAAAPADNAPGATKQKSEANVGQTLADLLKANGQ